MCDIEFTIEQGRLFLLQTRVGKRTAVAALRMAVEMEEEGLIDQREAVLRVQPAQLDQLLHPQFDPAATYTAITKGLNASPGAAVGKVYFTADAAEQHHDDGEARDPRAAGDLARRPARHDRGRGHPHVARRAREPRRGRRAWHGHARGVRRRASCTSTSRAARSRSTATIVHEGDVISINGTTGEVVVGAVPVVTPEPERAVRDHARLGRRVPPDEGAHQRRPARTTRRWRARFGAEGIGLCRTEHMFLGDRLPLVQRFILADDPVEEERRARGAREAAAHRLRGHLRGDGRPARHHPPARPAAARVPPRRRGAARPRRQGRARRRRAAGSSPPRSCGRRRTRCSARAAAASASSSPASTGCRPRRSSRRRSRASRPAATRTSRS